MGVEYEESCGNDFFQIAWPNGSGDKTESQKFCGFKNSYSNADSNFGTEFPAAGLMINSTEFELRWKSDWSLPGEGFELEWSCSYGDADDGPNIPKIDPCDLSFAFKFSIFSENIRKYRQLIRLEHINNRLHNFARLLAEENYVKIDV